MGEVAQAPRQRDLEFFVRSIEFCSHFRSKMLEGQRAARDGRACAQGGLVQQSEFLLITW
jgi:hypothetical protein